MLIRLLVAFLPWILLDILSGPTLPRLKMAIIVCLIASIIFGYKTLLKGFILTWATLLFFIAAFILMVLFQNIWTAIYLGILANATLALVTWLSVLFKSPFTLQFAKQNVDRSVWHNPQFLQGNYIITSFWGIIFTYNLVINVLAKFKNWPSSVIELNLYTMIVLGIVVTLIYSKWARKKREQQTH